MKCLEVAFDVGITKAVSAISTFASRFSDISWAHKRCSHPNSTSINLVPLKANVFRISSVVSGSNLRKQLSVIVSVAFVEAVKIGSLEKSRCLLELSLDPAVESVSKIEARTGASCT